MRAGDTRVGELKARQTGDDESMIFPTDTASHCPAEQWVPAMLEGVWTQATSAHEGGDLLGPPICRSDSVVASGDAI